VEHWFLIYKTQSYQKIFVLGAGAVDCYFGGMLAQALNGYGVATPYNESIHALFKMKSAQTI
jgi:ketopantoate reductase